MFKEKDPQPYAHKCGPQWDDKDILNQILSDLSGRELHENESLKSSRGLQKMFADRSAETNFLKVFAFLFACLIFLFLQSVFKL